MNLVVNMIPLTSGGGQRVGLNMIRGLQMNDFFEHTVHFFVTRGSEVEAELIRIKCPNWTSVPNHSLKRFWFEFYTARRLMLEMKTNIIYTVFGYGMFGSSVKQVCGVAYSNLFFPEVDFWQEYSGIALLKRKLVDVYRRWGLNKSCGLIFENQAMMERSHKLFSVPKERTTFIPPSIEIQEVKSLKTERFAKEGYTNILMLCGWQRNKNIHLVPSLAVEAKKRGIKLHFILTVSSDGSEDSAMFVKEMEEKKVSSMISLVGRIAPNNLVGLYSQINGVLLLSKLESFSNNIIESWAYKVPLFITKHEWAKKLCRNAAFYVDRDDIKDIIDRISSVVNQDELLGQYSQQAALMLSKHPSVDKKTRLEMKFLEYIHDI